MLSTKYREPEKPFTHSTRCRWALAYTRLYQYAGRPQDLRAACTLVDFVFTRAWDNHTCGGGLWWFGTNSMAPAPFQVSRRGKNAIENSLALVAATRLYRLTHNTTFLGWSRKLFDWWDNKFENAASLINDGINTDPKHKDYCHNNGLITWTYNQGQHMRIGANTGAVCVCLCNDLS